MDRIKADLNRPIILYMHAGSGNHGCEAIADSTVRLIRAQQKEEGAENYPLIIATNSAEEDRCYILGDLEKSGLCSIVEERHIDRDLIPHVLYYGYRKVTGDAESFLRYRFKDVFREFNSLVKESSFSKTTGKKPLAISIGGDNYCYPDMVKDLILAHNVFRKKGFDTMLWGCSVEPDSLRDRALLQDLMSYDLVYARESITYDALLNAGLSADRLYLRKDPAFDLKKIETDLPDSVQKGNAIGINLSPMVLERAKDPGLVRGSYRGFIRYILDETDQSILLIPHVVWAGSDDRKALKEFYEEFKETGRVHLVEDASAEVLKGKIAACSFFVGARTHSTIAAYSSGVPTLVIGYSVKSRGIAKDLFGTFEGYVLPVQEMSDPMALINGYKFIMSK